MAQASDIAFFTEEFPPHAGGGIAEWVQGLAEQLASRGFAVTVYCKRKKDFDYSCYRNRPYRFVPMAGHDWRKMRFWHSLRYLWKHLRRHPRALCVPATWELARPFAFLRQFFPDAHMVFGVYGTEVTRRLSPRACGQLGAAARAADLVVPISRFARAALYERIGCSHLPNALLLPTGVDTRRFARHEDTGPLRKRLGIPHDAPVILTIARVVRRKGQDTVIRALPQVLKEVPGCVYLIGGKGDPDFSAELHDLAREQGVEPSVRFAGFVPDEELSAWYSLAQVFVMASRELGGDTEGFGITFLEANACECPVIGSASGGITDAIDDGVNGFLVPPDNPQELARRIITLLGAPALRESLGRNGRARVLENFTWETVASRLVAALEKKGIIGQTAAPTESAGPRSPT